MTANPQPTEQKAVELKACPCCQSTRIIPPPKHWLDGCVYCRECGLRAVSPTAWNTRAARPLDTLQTDTRELLRQAMNTLGTVDNNDPLEPIADNGMTVWDGMRNESKRLWSKYRSLLASFNEGAPVG